MLCFSIGELWRSSVQSSMTVPEHMVVAYVPQGTEARQKRLCDLMRDSVMSITTTTMRFSHDCRIVVCAVGEHGMTTIITPSGTVGFLNNFRNL